MAKSKGNYKHGYFGTPTYKSWGEMIYRCKKGGRRYLVGRNIKVCDEWLRFDNFLKDMGKRPHNKSIDRIDNNNGYYKENCRWATAKEQGMNKSTTKFFEFNGKSHTLTDWAKIVGVKRSTLAQRYYVYGWSVDKVLLTN